MKRLKYSIFPVLICIGLFISCKKEGVDVVNSELIKSKKALLPDGGSESTPGSTRSVHVVKLSNGQFYAGYAGGLRFGNWFTYPSNLNDYQWYERFTPTFDTPIGDSNLIDFRMDGHKFIAVLGTALGGLVYKMNTKDYLEKFKTTIPAVSDYVSKVGGGTDGIILVPGKFLIDKNAPYGIAIFDINTPEYNGEFVPSYE
ncbi:MAG TPA: hypothetical protein DHU90_19290 [Sphingobacterium sp.]|nr:hypothetical protein [Sphingobacterium sp.]